MNFKKIAKVLSLGLVLTTTLTACGNKPGVAATVNGVDIPVETFNEEYAAQRNSIVLTSGEDYLKEKLGKEDMTIDQGIREFVLNNLVQMELVRQDAEKKDIKVDEKKVDEQINAIIEQSGSKEKFEEQLKEQGITEKFFRDYLAKQELVKEYQDNLKEELKISEEDAKAIYEKDKDKYFVADADHILVETEDEAKSIEKEIEEGKDFNELAKEKSKDPTAKDNGGKLGEFSTGQMVKEFEDAVVKMKEGEISDPVKTQFGYHLIKLNSLRHKEFDEVKDQIIETATSEKLTEYLNKLEKDAKVKKYINPKKDYELPEELKVKVPGKEADDKNTEGSKNETKNNKNQGTENKTNNQKNQNNTNNKDNKNQK